MILGARYGMNSIKTTLAMLVRKYKFSTSYKCVEDIEVMMKIILRPIHGFKLAINFRN